MITEKTLSPERLSQIEGRGRGRLLHPISELTRLGLATLPASVGDQSNQVAYVPEGEKPVLQVDSLNVYYPIRKGMLRRVVGHVRAVDGISFNVYKGQTLGLVGESGCGKTTTGRAILRLLPITSGTVTFDG